MTIVAITGTPGVGKSIVAKLLAKKLGWTLVDLNQLASENKLYSGYDKSRKTNIVDIKKIEQAVKKLRGNLILDAHYSHDLESDLRVILRCDIKELRTRLVKRSWGGKKIEENVQAEIFNICGVEAEKKGKVLELDTTKKTPKQLVSEIMKTLKIREKQ